MTKDDLRADLRAKRRDYVIGLSEEQIQAYSTAMANSINGLLDTAQVVAGYVPSRYEARPLATLQFAARRGLITALPFFSAPGALMQFVRWDPADKLVPGPFGILQPADGSTPISPDFIITPLVGFDNRLSRLGQGGGHYDRWFERMPNAFRLGLAWSVQQVSSIKVEPWDVPMHAIVTELHLWTSDRTI